MERRGYWTHFARQLSRLELNKSVVFAQICTARDCQRFRSSVFNSRLLKNLMFTTKRLESGVLLVTRIEPAGVPGDVGYIRADDLVIQKRVYRQRKDWSPYALQVAALRMGESVCFPDLANDQKSMGKIRVAIAGSPHSKVVRIRIAALPQGIKITRFEGNGKFRERQKVETDTSREVAPAAVVATDGKCMERACPFPAGSNGLCRQHTRWAQEMVSRYGSSLDEKSLSGA